MQYNVLSGHDWTNVCDFYPGIQVQVPPITDGFWVCDDFLTQGFGNLKLQLDLTKELTGPSEVDASRLSAYQSSLATTECGGVAGATDLYPEILGSTPADLQRYIAV